jgi:hypothetical protein
MVSLYEQMAMVGHYLATMKLPLIVLARLRKYALEFHLYSPKSDVRPREAVHARLQPLYK